MAHIVQHGFELFRDDELLVGHTYALNKDGFSLKISRLREIMNDAGKTRINAEGQERQLTPREAITRAVKAFEHKYRGVKISQAEYTAFVHAGAKMFSERNLITKTKRTQEREVDQSVEVAYGIQHTPDMDPRTAYEIAHGLTGHPLETKADA